MQLDRASETSTTTGTGSYELDGAVSSALRTFVNAGGNGARGAYVAEMGDSWEICEGVVSAGTPATLTRNLIASSTGALINWGAGTKIVYSALPSDLARFGAVGSVPTATGTANAPAIAHLPPLRRLLPGMGFRWLVAAVNSGAATLNVDGLGASAIRKRAGADALVAGDLVPGLVAEVVWDGTYFRLLSPTIPTVVSITAATGAGVQLPLSPVGSYWEYILYQYNGSGAFTGGFTTGVGVAGAVLDAGTGGLQWVGTAKRVA